MLIIGLIASLLVALGWGRFENQAHIVFAIIRHYQIVQRARLTNTPRSARSLQSDGVQDLRACGHLFKGDHQGAPFLLQNCCGAVLLSSAVSVVEPSL